MPTFKTPTFLKFFLLSLSFVLGLAACSFPGVYKLDIPQGNILEQDKINQLELGMNKRQVRYLLGTPMLVDSFNQDRWDYVYRLIDNQENVVQQRMTLTFTNGLLSHIDKNLFTDQTPAMAADDTTSNEQTDKADKEAEASEQNNDHKE